MEVFRSKRRIGLLTLVLAAFLLAAPMALASGEAAHGEAAEPHAEAAEGHAEAAGHAGGEHGDHGDHGTKGWAATDTYRVMNFVVLAVVLFFLLRKPMVQALDNRIQGIRDQLKELEEKKAAAQKELADYTQKIARLDEEAEQILAEYTRQGEEAKERILKEAESAAEKLEQQAKRNIENEFENARKALQAEIIEKSLAKAEELIQEQITAEDQDRLVDEYLEKVVA